MSNYTEALAVAAAFCSSAEHCKSEVLDKMAKFQLEDDEQIKLIQRLQQEGFMDENRYVRAFVNDRFRFNKWGRIKIRYMLNQKGIHKELIEQGLDFIPEEDYKNSLLALLMQKRPTLKSKTNYELRGKMLRYAAGKGFEPSLISECLKKIDILENEND